MKEIEIKGWVENYEAVKELLASRFSFIRDYHKRDLYYTLQPGSEIPILRLRDDTGTWIITKKHMELIDGLEINDELEITVSSGEIFQKILKSIGFELCCLNEKIGTEFQQGAMHFELSHITGLGDFLEIELLLEDPDKQACKEGEALVRRTLSELNQTKELIRIESKYYTDMIAEKQGMTHVTLQNTSSSKLC